MNFLLLLSVLCKLNSPQENPPNIHHWTIKLNNSVVHDTRQNGHVAGKINLNASEMTKSDTLEIIYNTDAHCGEIPLILLRDKKGNVLIRCEGKNKIPVAGLLFLNKKEIEFHYTYKCGPHDHWNTATRSLLSISIQ